MQSKDRRDAEMVSKRIACRFLRDASPSCFTEMLSRLSARKRSRTRWSYAPGPNNTRRGSKVQRRDCIGFAKEQTSTDTLYLHDFMSNQPALPRANCLFPKPIRSHSVKFYSNNHSFGACQLRFCEAVTCTYTRSPRVVSKQSALLSVHGYCCSDSTKPTSQHSVGCIARNRSLLCAPDRE